MTMPRPKKPTKAQLAKLNPQAPVVFLLNGERVLTEIAELAKLHIAGLLEVEPEAVKATLELGPGGKVIPEFNVEMPNAGAIERQYIQKGIAEVWLGWCKQELADRLRGLSEVRRYAPEEASPNASPEAHSGPEKASEEPTPEGG